ncbi:MAG TPA: nucleotide exchange factor GrpE [Acidimicrobiales bacterium]|nr:nucleotide exchange factor GrpE [Acidimicrobiales bacterium]
MSGRPDHAAARWRDDGVEEAGEAPVTDAGGSDAGGPDAAEAVEDAGPILTDVAALSAQRDEYLESLQRLKADFDNYRKRVARLQEEQSARAEAGLVAKLLPALDNLDLAWAHLGPRDGGVDGASEEARAIWQARAQVLDVLGKEGLERVDEVGVGFDPTVHDAVAHTESPGDAATGEDAPTAADAGAHAHADADADADAAGAGDAAGTHDVSVDEVLRAGYRWRGQVLRPAMVRVRG